jgi:hypothetical protein
MGREIPDKEKAVNFILVNRLILLTNYGIIELSTYGLSVLHSKLFNYPKICKYLIYINYSKSILLNNSAIFGLPGLDFTPKFTPRSKSD